MNKVTYKDILTERNYMQELIATLISRFGDSIDSIAYSWIMYEVTGNASLLAFIMALNYIPTICFQPFLAVLAERMEKKKVEAWTLFGRGLIVLCTILLYQSGHLSSLYLMAATLLTSTLEALSNPAGSALIPKLIPMEKIAAAKGLSSSLSTITELIGMSLAGSIVAFRGAQTALLIDAATFLISAIIIRLLPFKEELTSEKLSMPAFRADLTEGFRYLKSSKILLGIIVIGMSLNMINVPFNSFQSIFVADYLHLDAQALSAFGVSMMLGMLSGSLLAPKAAEKFGMRKGIVLSGILFSPFYILSGVLPFSVMPIPAVYAVMTAGMLLSGLGLGMVSVMFSTVFVQNVNTALLARVSGMTNALLTSMMPVTALISSVLAIFLKVNVIFLLVGIANLALYIFVARAKFFAPLDQ